MTNNLMKIIKGVLDNNPVEQFPCDIDALYQLAVKHNLDSFLHIGLQKFTLSYAQKERIRRDYLVAVKRDTVQEIEYKKIIDAFEKNKIPCLPLKGILLKNDYPERYLREMTDVDILIQPKDVKKAQKVMIELGYDREKKFIHHIEYAKKPIMNVEIHNQLVNDKRFCHQDLKHIWDRVFLVSNREYEYQMTDDDFYYYMVVHLLKHYLLGGTGLRSFVDLYVYAQKHVINHQYIEEKLGKYNLLQHCKDCEELSQVLFGMVPYTEKTMQMEKIVSYSGTYGTMEMLVAMELNEMPSSSLLKRKIKLVFRRLFPLYDDMKIRYPFLNKLPIFLPLCYLFRLLGLLFHPVVLFRKIRAVFSVKSHNIKKK